MSGVTMPTITVSWTINHGYASEHAWIKTADDTTETGIIVGFVSESGTTKAVIQSGGALITVDLSDLTVINGDAP